MIGKLVAAPDANWAFERCRSLAEDGQSWAIGYFHAETSSEEDIAKNNLAAICRFASCPGDGYLAVKAPPLDFDHDRILSICKLARSAGLQLMFDSHALKWAGPTLDVVIKVSEVAPDTGFALPARWRRSENDAKNFRDSSARIRLIKGEWPDVQWHPKLSISDNYLKLAELLAGRRAKVAVATHDPELAQRALSILLNAGTPCELEQLRGLPSRRTSAVARSLGVPIRVYLPFGPGWWPYAINEALARPYLLSWAARDRCGMG